MILDKKKSRFGFLIKWIISVGDILLINTICVVIYKIGLFSLIDSSKIGEILLIINLLYFVCRSMFSSTFLEENIIFFDKIIQQSISFISLYYILLTSILFTFDFIDFDFSIWISGYSILSILFLLWHIILRSALKWNRRKGRNYKRIIIVGSGQSADSVFHELKSDVYGYKILAQFSNDNYHIKNLHKGKLLDINQFCIDNSIDEIFCTLPNNNEAEIIKLINFSERNMIRFYLVPDFYEYIKRKLILDTLQTVPIIAIRPEPLEKRANQLVKRTFDIIFSLIVSISILPIVYIFFGAIIRLTSKGPIIFKQKRTGLGGKEFTCYKFRSMQVNSTENTATTTKADPRITKIGLFMRRTSIDELPQFINVLLGNMSVVGPRPHMSKQTDLYKSLIDKFMIRHLIKPGITGWAQISGFRGETTTVEQMEQRFRKDIWYLENWTFLLDLKIITVTVFQILRGDKNVF